jgi:hypothetical protein
MPVRAAFTNILATGATEHVGVLADRLPQITAGRLRIREVGLTDWSPERGFVSCSGGHRR